MKPLRERVSCGRTAGVVRRLARSSSLLSLGLGPAAEPAAGCGGRGRRGRARGRRLRRQRPARRHSDRRRHRASSDAGRLRWRGRVLHQLPVADGPTTSSRCSSSTWASTSCASATGTRTRAASGTTPDTAFTDTATVAIVQKATAALGHPPKILMSSWSPPAYLKSNGLTKGSARHAAPERRRVPVRGSSPIGGCDRSPPIRRRAWCPTTSAFRTSPISSTPVWETCQLDTRRGRDQRRLRPRARRGVGGDRRVRRWEPSRKIVGPETSGVNNGVQRYLNNMTPSSFDVVAHHLYNGGMAGNDPAPDSFATTMTNAAKRTSAAAGKPIFMTEFAPQAPSLFNTAWMIQDALTTEGVVGVHLLGPDLGAARDGGRGAGRPGHDRGSGSVVAVHDQRHVLRDEALRALDRSRLDARRRRCRADRSAIRSSAFVSPDGASLTVVLLNTDSADHVVSVDPGAVRSRPPPSTERRGRRARGGRSLRRRAIPLPAQSIATLVLTP